MLRILTRAFAIDNAIRHKAAVILTGCGSMDGSEIHEATSAIISLSSLGMQYQCYAPNIKQYHTINHLINEEANQPRNVLEEAARIARGNVKNMEELKASDYDILVVPGGFGVAKNLSDFAFKNEKFTVSPSFEKVIMDFYNNKKVMAFCCISPLIAAKVFSKNGVSAKLSMGMKGDDWKFSGTIDIMKDFGLEHVDTHVMAHSYDEAHKILCTPCYMSSKATPATVYRGINTMLIQANNILNRAQKPKDIGVNKKVLPTPEKPPAGEEQKKKKFKEIKPSTPKKEATKKPEKDNVRKSDNDHIKNSDKKK